MQVHHIEAALAEEVLDLVADEGVDVDSCGIAGGEGAKGWPQVMGVAVLGQHAVTGRASDGNLMLHGVKLVGEIEHMAGYAARVGQVVGVNKKDSQMWAWVFPLRAASAEPLQAPVLAQTRPIVTVSPTANKRPP